MEPNSRNGNRVKQVELTAADIPLHCPLPSQSVWNYHPRVFLPLDEHGEALCPYCGTPYVLRGAVKSAH